MTFALRGDCDVRHRQVRPAQIAGDQPFEGDDHDGDMRQVEAFRERPGESVLKAAGGVLRRPGPEPGIGYLSRCDGQGTGPFGSKAAAGAGLRGAASGGAGAQDEQGDE